MRFIKLQAEKIFDGYRFRKNETLVLRCDGVVEGFVPNAEAGEGVQWINGILSPGFINCHCHMELSHMRGMIDEGTGLLQFVGQVVQKRNVDKAIVQQAISDAENQMMINGIVAVGDICNRTDTIAQKQKRNLYYHNFIEALGSDAKQAERNFDIFKTTYDTFCEALGQKKVSLAPHAPYSVSMPLWQKIINIPGNELMTLHNQETEEENQWFENKTGGFTDMFARMQIDQSAFVASGKTSLQTVLPKFLPHQPVILVHNVYAREADIQFAKKQPNHLYWCLCPNANEYISKRLPDVPTFIKNDCTLVLGTDSLASNNQLSIWEEIKTLQKHFPEISLEQMLQWATINGAKALQASEKLGSFEKGKKPGVIIITDEKVSVIVN